MFSDGISKHAYYYMIEIERKNLLMIVGYQNLKWCLLMLYMIKWNLFNRYLKINTRHFGVGGVFRYTKYLFINFPILLYWNCWNSVLLNSICRLYYIHESLQECVESGTYTCLLIKDLKESIYLFLKIYLFTGKSDIQRGGETEKKIFHLMIHSPSECNSRWYADPKSGARNFFWVSHMGARSQSFGPTSTASTG